MTEVFSRSDAGLSNTHLFYGVDYMVFVEGGDGNMQVDGSSSRSFDELFWGVTFRVFSRSDRSYRIQCNGGKNNLLEIAKRIRKGAVTNIVVSMDRDYDDFSGRNPVDDVVLITRGYSWENDVWDHDICFRLFRTISPLAGEDDEVRDIVSSVFDALNEDCRFLIWSDSILYCAGESLLAAKYEKELIAIGVDHCPHINMNGLRVRLNQTRKRNRAKMLRRTRKASLRGAMDIRGKFVASFAVELINGLLKISRVREKIGKFTATGIALNELESVLRSAGENHNLAEYYGGVFERLNLALA